MHHFRGLTDYDLVNFEKMCSAVSNMNDVSIADMPCMGGCVCQLELLAASNLPAGSMSGTSDPYAVITCGKEKRFR